MHQEQGLFTYLGFSSHTGHEVHIEEDERVGESTQNTCRECTHCLDKCRFMLNDRQEGNDEVFSMYRRTI